VRESERERQTDRVERGRDQDRAWDMEHAQNEQAREIETDIDIHT